MHRWYGGFVVAAALLFLSGCSRQVTLNLTVDGIPVSSELRTLSSPDPNCGIRADWYFARWFSKPIGKKEQAEFEPSSQPLAFDELNTLPGDTEVVSMHLRVVNPKGLRYRVTKVFRQGEKAVQTPEIIYEGSRVNNFLVVRGPIVQGKILSLGVIMGVVENHRERPLFYAGDLEYRIEPKSAQDLPTLASAQSAGASPDSGEEKRALTIAPEARSRLLAPSAPLPEPPLLAKLPEAKEHKPATSLGESPSPVDPRRTEAVDSLQGENWSPGATPAPFKTESATESPAPVEPGSAGVAPAAAAAETPGRLSSPGKGTDLPLPGTAAGSPPPVEPGWVAGSPPSGATAAPVKTESAQNLPSPARGDLASRVGKGHPGDSPRPPLPSAPPRAGRQIFYVGAEPLDVRAYPDKDALVLSVLARNEAVEQVGELEDWVQVRVKRTGRLGWVNTSYLASRPAATAPEARPRPLATSAPPPRPETPPLAKPAAKEPAPASPLGKSNIADLTPPVEGKRAVSVPTPVEREKIAGSPAPVAKESPGRSTSPGVAKDLPLTGAAGESPSPGEPGRAAASPPAVDSLQNMENWSPGAIPAPAKTESGTAAQ